MQSLFLCLTGSEVTFSLVLVHSEHVFSEAERKEAAEETHRRKGCMGSVCVVTFLSSVSAFSKQSVSSCPAALCSDVDAETMVAYPLTVRKAFLQVGRLR